MTSNITYNCEIIPSDAIHVTVPYIFDMLETIANTSNNKIQGKDFIAEFVLESMQLWLVRRNGEICGIAITEIVRYPRKQVCNVVGVTGTKIAEWIYLIKEVEYWAFCLGCNGMANVGRPGYEKLLAGHGYKKTHVLLEKQLEFYDA